MQGRTPPNATETPHLQARRMYQRVVTQWAGDYLVCRSLWTRPQLREDAPSSGTRFTPAAWELGED